MSRLEHLAEFVKVLLIFLCNSYRHFLFNILMRLYSVIMKPNRHRNELRVMDVNMERVTCSVQSTIFNFTVCYGFKWFTVAN